MYSASNQTLQRNLVVPPSDAVYFEYIDHEEHLLLAKGEVVELFRQSPDEDSASGSLPIYHGRKYIADNEPTTLISIVHEPATEFMGIGYAYTSRIITDALVEETTSGSMTVGAILGPSHGELVLQEGKPGYIYLGRTDPVDDLTHAVMKVNENTTGQGVTVDGQSEYPSTLNLEGVTFSSGLDCWDGTTPLTVVNAFGDRACDGMIVQFKWAITQFVSTDVSCCPEPDPEPV